MLTLDMKIKVSFETKNPKKVFLPLRPFFYWFKTKISIWSAPTYRWDPYGNYGVWKRWGNKTSQSTSNKQSWASWFVKKWTSWRCGIAIFVKSSFLCYSDVTNCPRDTVRNITITKWKIIVQNVLFHIITDFCNNMGIWGGAETSFGFCSSSAENPPKISPHGNLNTSAPKHGT